MILHLFFMDNLTQAYAHLDYSAQIESAEMMDGMYDTANEAPVMGN